MRGILCISHGKFAEAFTGSWKMIAGPVTNLHYCCLEPTDGPAEFGAKLSALEPELEQYDNVVVFADLFGGSPCNTTFQHFFKNPKMDFVAGMNFPMVLTAILNEEMDVDALIAQGQEAIVDVKKFNQSMSFDDED